MASQSSSKQHIAILGAGTLLGREVKDVVGTRGSSARIVPYALEDDAEVEEKAGEAVTLETLTAKSFASLSTLILAGSPKTSSLAYDLAKASGTSVRVIDCLGHLESRPEARILAPLVQESAIRSEWLLVVAHPAASALVLVMQRLARYRPLATVIANVLAPASERGKPGVSELHQQTTALLNFKPLKKAIFDTQLSFNLLPRLGEDAPVQLSSAEFLIDRQIATLLSQQETPSALPIPSVRLIQAPVFHGYSVSLWIEFSSEVRVSEIEEALASAQIEIRRQDEEPPDNVGVASQSGLIAGDIRIDGANPRAAWIWIVFDNLRSVADATAEIVRSLSASQSL